jgi:3-(methylthio)propanoyl-CoA dehydrogenase
MLANAKSNTDAVAAGAVAYQRQFAVVAGGYMMARMAKAAHDALFDPAGDALFYNTRLVTARFFAESLLPQIYGLSAAAMGGNAAVSQIANDQF